MRQKQLDGVRGIAVLMVVAYHHYLFSAGWVGVDLFFVLSGFLITRILFNGKNQDHYWSTFYIKRAGRIFPPLLLLFVIAFIVSRHVTAIGLFGYALFLGNYMDLTRYSAQLLSILWSLAIEEHFYLIWPLAVRYLTEKRNIQILITILILEPLFRMAATHVVSNYLPIYYLTWFRLDSIAAGSLLALAMERSGMAARLLNWSLPMCAAAAIGYAILSMLYRANFSREANSLVFNGLGYSLVSMTAFFLIAHLVLNKEGRLSKILSVKPLVFIGEISYGMYLFHETILALTRRVMGIGTGPASAAATAKLFWLNLPLVIAISWLSFMLFESPLIQWSKRIASSVANKSMWHA